MTTDDLDPAQLARFRAMTKEQLLVGFLEASQPTDYGRAWYEQHATAAERFQYRTMSFEEVFNKLIDKDQFVAFAAAVELDRRARDAGCARMSTFVLRELWSMRVKSIEEATAK
jgi:hypothetical protein